MNWGVKPPEDAIGPNPDTEGGPTCESVQSGSIIECESQGLGERIPLAGTGLTLNWRSSRVVGGPSYRLRVQLSDSTQLPSSLLKMTATAEVAGQRLPLAEYAPGPNAVHEFVWDGKDVYGRPVQGAAPIDVCVNYVYPLEYVTLTSWATSKFGYKGNGAVIGVSDQTTSLTQCLGRIPIGTGGDQNAIATPRKLLIGGLDAQHASDALGGWTLSNHHTFSKESSVVYYGDGTKRSVGEGMTMIEAYAGNNLATGPFDGADRLSVQIPSTIWAMEVAPDGDVYIGYAGRIIRVEHDDDLVYTVVGTGTPGYSGDGGMATSAQIQTPTGIDFGPDGSMFFWDGANYRIRRVRTDGVVETVAGNGFYHGQNGITSIEDYTEGVPATSLPLGGGYVTPGKNTLAVGPEGEIYFTTKIGSPWYIRQVTTNGMVRHVAGYPRGAWSPNPNPFTSPGYGFPTTFYQLLDGGGIAVDKKGDIWVGQSGMARLDGIANSVSPATDWNSGAGPIAVTPEGQPIWIHKGTDQVATLIDDEITPIAGTGTSSGAELGSPVPALNAKLSSALFDVAIGPDGSVYVSSNKVIGRIYLDGPGSLFDSQTAEIPSADGSEVHVFDDEGRHLFTRDALTGVTKWTFGYDGAGRLLSVTDRNQRTTTITRDGAGVATSIVSPDGVVTNLVMTDGRLTGVTDANSDT